MEEVSELEALIPFNVRKLLSEPIERETAHECAFVTQGLDVPRMRPDMEHSAS